MSILGCGYARNIHKSQTPIDTHGGTDLQPLEIVCSIVFGFCMCLAIILFAVDYKLVCDVFVSPV